MRVPSSFGLYGSQQVFHRKGCSFSGLAESAAFVNTGWLPLIYDDMQSVYVAQIVLFVLNLNFYQPVSGRSGYLDRFLQVHIGSFFFSGLEDQKDRVPGRVLLNLLDRNSICKVF